MCVSHRFVVPDADADAPEGIRAVKKPHAAQKKKGRPKPVQEEKAGDDEPLYR